MVISPGQDLADLISGCRPDNAGWQEAKMGRDIVEVKLPTGLTDRKTIRLYKGG